MLYPALIHTRPTESAGRTPRSAELYEVDRILRQVDSTRRSRRRRQQARHAA